MVVLLKNNEQHFLRKSKKCEADQKKELAKLKKAIEKSQTDIARIHAENAIRKKNEGVNFLKLSAKMDAVTSRLDTAVKMGQVTKAMGCVVKGFDKVLGQMNPEKVSELMDHFERQMEDFDVNEWVLVDAIGGSTAGTVPNSEVEDLIAQVAHDYSIDLRHQVGSVTNQKIAHRSERNGTDSETLRVK